MMSTAELSTEDRDLLLKFRSRLEEGSGTIIHDMNDPEHRAFVKLMHNLGGNTEEDFPGLHQMIASPQLSEPTANLAMPDDAAMLGDAEGGWVTAFGIPEVGWVPATLVAAAGGYGTVVNGFQTCNLSVLVLSPQGAILAHGSSAGQAPLNSLKVLTNTASAKPFVGNATAMMTYSYQQSDGQTHSGTVYSPAGYAVADPVVIEPKRENGNTHSYNPNAICIGLGRPNDLTSCDYIYDEPTQNNPVGRLPLVGNVMFNMPIMPLQAGSNFLVDIYVIRTDTGGKSTQLDPTDLTNIYNNFTISSSNPKMLTWNLPMKANTSPPPPVQPYNPVVFSNIPWATEMVSYLTCNITVMLDNGTPAGYPATVTIQSSDLSDNNPIDGVTYIKPIEFVWHCLGEDTQVTMTDGTLRAITDIKAGDTVNAGEGGESATVSVTHNDRHFHHVFELETDCGKTLIASAEHLIFTDEGPLPARKLAPGMHLITSEGSGVLVAVRKQSGAGRVLWNLSLGEAPQIIDPNPDVGQFFANGILVGDARANRAIRHRQINDIEWVKAHVPESFHRDVESTFRRERVLMR